MKRRKSDRWSYIAGEKNANRVRVFARPTSDKLYIEWKERGSDGLRKVTSRCLGHANRSLAKKEAEELALELRTSNGRALRREPLTVGKLIDIREGEETAYKGTSTRQHERRAMRLFEKFFGRARNVASLDRTDWEGFIRARRSGQLTHDQSKYNRHTQGKAVRNRVIEQDLRFLRSMCDWATTLKGPDGDPLLDRNPFASRFFRTPREQSPKRPIYTPEEVEKLYQVAPQLGKTFALLLTTVHHTGHRISAVCALQWSDIDPVAGRIVWRAENDKKKYEHTPKMRPALLAALTAAHHRARLLLPFNPWVFPAPPRPSVPIGIDGLPVRRSRANPAKQKTRLRPAHVSREVAAKWLKTAEKLAGVPHIERRGWHGFRRRFATDLKDQPLSEVMALGGWKDPKTVLQSYQQSDEASQERALQSGPTAHLSMVI